MEKDNITRVYEMSPEGDKLHLVHPEVRRTLSKAAMHEVLLRQDVIVTERPHPQGPLVTPRRGDLPKETFSLPSRLAEPNAFVTAIQNRFGEVGLTIIYNRQQ